MRRVPSLRSSAWISSQGLALRTATRCHAGHGHSHGRCGDASQEHSHSHATPSGVSDADRAECRRVTIVGGVSNVLIGVTKVLYGTSGGSYALLADGVHALVDVCSDVISYGAIVLTSIPMARCRFPFGVGRVETAGSVVVSAFLLFGGAALMWGSAYRVLVRDDAAEGASRSEGSEPSTLADLRDDGHSHHGGGGDDHSHNHHDHATHGHSHFDVFHVNPVTGEKLILWEMVAIAAASLVVKELLFRWTRRVGERAHSRVVVANAYHHRADAWSSAVALAGVTGHVAGFPLIDAVAGFVVSLYVTRIGWDLLNSSVLEFFDYQFVHELGRLQSHIIRHGQHLNPPAVNVFAVRHGHSYVLHATLLVKPETTSKALEESTGQLVKLASDVVRVSDHYVNFVHIPSISRDNTHPGASADSVLVDHQGMKCSPRVASFLRAVAIIESFHGITLTLLAEGAKGSAVEAPTATGEQISANSAPAQQGTSAATTKVLLAIRSNHRNHHTVDACCLEDVVMLGRMFDLLVEFKGEF